MKVFIISDTHFGHENIIRYCNRPFSSVEEMDRVMIENWNRVVGKDDLVLHLGDFCFYRRKTKVSELVGKLNGRKLLIMGNHDNHSEQFYRDCGFHTVSRFPILWDSFYLLSHAPLKLSETTPLLLNTYGLFPYLHFYGHVHNDSKYIDTLTSKCVSVERIGYTPMFLMEM